MDAAGMDAILARLRPDEVRDALWLIGVFERWNDGPLAQSVGHQPFKGREQS